MGVTDAIQGKRNVYLFQVNNRFGRNVFLPYSVGLLWAYARQDPAISKAYSLKSFEFLRRPFDEVVSALETPDVVGLSCYIWNWRYTMGLAEAIKEAFPDCLIVAGGPQVPIADPEFFEGHPFIDLAVHYEGEITFSEILRQRSKRRPITRGSRAFPTSP